MTSPNWQQRAEQTDFQVNNLINGKLTATSAGSLIDKRSPRDGTLLYQLHQGDASEINLAVSGARQAFDDGRWSRTTIAHRQSVLCALADLIDKHKDEFALYECLDAGKPISDAAGEVPQASAMLREVAHNADKLFNFHLADGAYTVHQVRKPIGVVGAIIGWNYPLVMAVVKVAPVLMMGNSLVLKPSEFTSLSAWRLAELALEAGVPNDVFNVVNGAGATVGATLASHNDVDMMSFTGSSATGKKMQVAAGNSNMKRLMLECGGKSPYLVFDDLKDDLDFLAADVAGAAFRNQSANCMAGSRLLVHETIAADLVPKIVAQAQRLVPGDILNPDVNYGAIINEPHLEKILGYVDSAKKEGGQLLCGGQRLSVDTSNGNAGYYVSPAVVDQVRPKHRLFQEEVFGPVLAVTTFKDEAEAIELANDSTFGLAAYAATTNVSRIHRLSQALQAGTFMISASSNPPEAFHDVYREGHKQSGYGAESGLAGLLSYSVQTTVHQWM